MSRIVDRETVVTWRCDLCGKEEILSGGGSLNTEQLPPDWCPVVMIDRRQMVHWGTEPAPYSHSTSPGDWRLLVHRDSRSESTPPGDIYTLCPVCRKGWKRLVADAKANSQKPQKPPPTPMPSAGMLRPSPGELRGAAPSGCMLSFLAPLFGKRGAR